MDNPLLVHVDEADQYLLHEELQLLFVKNYRLLPQDAVQVKLEKLKDKVDSLALASDNIDQLNDIGVIFKLLKHLNLSNRRDWESLVCFFVHLDLLQSVDLVVNLSSINFAKSSLVNKLFLFENFRCTQF